MDAGAFKLNRDNIASILAWDSQGAWIVDEARYRFSVLSDGAVRRQHWQDANPPCETDEAEQITEWMAKQVETMTVGITEEDRDGVGGKAHTVATGSNA